MSLLDTSRGKFPSVRMRRMRRDGFSKKLMQENKLSVDDLIYPMFIIEGQGKRQAIPSMPGIERVSIDELLKEASQLHALGIPAVALFPVTEQDKKNR